MSPWHGPTLQKTRASCCACFMPCHACVFLLCLCLLPLHLQYSSKHITISLLDVMVHDIFQCVESLQTLRSTSCVFLFAVSRTPFACSAGTFASMISGSSSTYRPCQHVVQVTWWLTNVVFLLPVRSHIEDRKKRTTTKSLLL